MILYMQQMHQGAFPPAASTIGAVIPADVIMATVPEPCTKRTSVAMRNGRIMMGSAVAAIPFAI